MTPKEIAAAVASALQPGRFFVAEPLRLRIEQRPRDTCFWEVFRGHLLDRGQTRLEKTFTSWDVILDPPRQPIISVKYDAADQCIHVVRCLEVYGWEAHEAAGIIESREARKWARELVGTIDLASPEAQPALYPLRRLVFLAVTGTSRLPITSLESPLPQFSLGQFGYVDAWRPESALAKNAVAEPRTVLRELPLDITADWDPLFHRIAGTAENVELVLRATTRAEIAEIAQLLAARFQSLGDRGPQFAEGLFKLMFNQVALTPYTPFIDNLSALLSELAASTAIGLGPVIDIISYMLRHLVRHLTSYNLRTFHNLGSNYPDALALDALLCGFIDLVDRCPGAFAGSEPKDRLRRRALRQAWMIRKQLEGLPVPDQPTSPGENLRVLPEPHQRIAEEQLRNVAQRTRRLFDGEPAERLLTAPAREVLRQSLRELPQAPELRELGMGVFLDRPLGIFKQRGEVDCTPLLSYEAFSRSIARGRLESLQEWRVLPPEDFRDCSARLEKILVAGVAVADLPDRERAGVVSLEEARRAADDFVFLRTTRSSLQQFLAQTAQPGTLRSEANSAEWFGLQQYPLIIRTPQSMLQGSPPPLLTVFDDQLQARLHLFVAQNDGQPVRYRESMGVETLADGLRVAPPTT